MPKKLTQEEFIARCTAKHGGRYDYSLVEYVNSSKKVKIICQKHGEFEQIANDHIRGTGCWKCSGCSKLTFDDFLEKAKARHGEKYKYHLSMGTFKNSHSKVKIFCDLHGEFEQTVYAHIAGQGCYECGMLRNSQRNRKNVGDFISQAREVHGEFYDYSLVEYKTAFNKVAIVCPEHGVFEQEAKAHLKGHGCLECSRIQYTTKEIVDGLIEVHGDEYDYSNVEYKGHSEKIEIKCKVHGSFYQTPYSHKAGSGCPECWKDIAHTGYKREFYISHINKKHKGVSHLYVLHCVSDNEEFYKVGITWRPNVRTRFSGKLAMPYDYQVLKNIKGRVGFIWDLETQLHRMLREYKYQPLEFFNGHTECFSHIPKEVIKFLDSLEKSNQLPLIA